MKELSIEEKAKAYDEAIERAVKIHRNYKGRVCAVDVVIEEVFSELKESENERIRKAIIKHFKAGTEYVSFSGFSKSEIIAWLEKQGEQNPVIEMKSAEESLGIDSETYSKIVDECIYGEQKPTEWSEEDEQLYNDLSDTYFYNDEDYPEETYKRMLKRVLDWMNKRAKFLRPQSTWKPSDEQMKALNYVVNLMASSESPKENDYYYNVFKDLREQLKKLREKRVMKANEAPEKIYLRHNHKGDIGAGWLIFPLTNNEIEYTQTDAFIDKACVWLECNLSDTTDIEFWIEEFVKFMKGEQV